MLIRGGGLQIIKWISNQEEGIWQVFVINKYIEPDLHSMICENIPWSHVLSMVAHVFNPRTQEVEVGCS